MKEPSDLAHPALNSKTPAARVLFQKRDEVLSVWVARVKREVKTAGSLLNPIIIDTFPVFIENLAESLCEETSRQTPTQYGSSAQEHGSERARVTRYGPDQLIKEYQILREVVREQISLETPLREQDEKILQGSFDDALQESMLAYFLVHNRIREQFVATLTHDLRNPIGAVKMAGELIMDIVSDGPSELASAELLDLATRIVKNAKRSDRMIQDMLDATVVQTGEKLTIQVSAVDLDQIIRDAVATHAENPKFNLVYDGQPIQGFWDSGSLQRSLENLIGNALKYGDSSKPVTVKAQAMHERVIISVHNFGNPIPAENLESLFQVFRRAEAAKSGTVKGWGIGLAMARSTAESLGGSLVAESNLEKGTTFTIDIPRDSRPFQDS